ncbi:MAG: alpha/beta fold hydrolase [Cognatishimia sp.]
MTNVFWRSLGTGENTALALHCSLAHSGAWRGVSDALSPQLSLRTLDFPGHGKSQDWDGSGDFADCAFTAAATGLVAPTDIVAHSFGAYIALRLAAEFPDKVRRLVLYEPVFFAVLNDTHLELAARNNAEMRHIAGLIALGDTALAARLFLRIWGDGTPWQDLSKEVQDSFVRGIHLTCAIQPAIAEDNADLLPRLSTIKAPVLLIDGGQSPEYMPKVQNILAKLLPNAKRSTVLGARHMGPITHATEVAGQILKHLIQS